MQRRIIQSQTMNSDRPQVNMLLAHTIAQLGEHGFYLDISSPSPELISAEGSTRVRVADLPTTQLLAVKHLAHDQYVRAMLHGDLDLDSHRATLNFLSRMVQKSTPAQQANPSRAPQPRRRTQRTDKQAA